MFNNKAHVKHIERLLEMSKEGTFKYAGRDTAPDPLIVSGEAAISFGSSQFARQPGEERRNSTGPRRILPYDPEIIPSPMNSIIGGASLWTMTAPDRTPEEYKAVAEFLKYIGQPEVDAVWAQNTGYVPVTFAGYEPLKQQDYYAKAVGADCRSSNSRAAPLTPNTEGLRLGRLPEIRNIIQEELEKALQGGQTAQQAMDMPSPAATRC